MAALKETITEDELIKYFSAFGKVVRAVKSIDRTSGVKKTFGFVDFSDFGIVKKVVLCGKHYIQGKRIRYRTPLNKTFVELFMVLIQSCAVIYCRFCVYVLIIETIMYVVSGFLHPKAVTRRGVVYAFV